MPVRFMQMQCLVVMRWRDYHGTGVRRSNVSAAPFNGTQIVNGSPPSCSVTILRVLFTGPGTVMGIEAEQVLPGLERETPFIVSVGVSQ